MKIVKAMVGQSVAILGQHTLGKYVAAMLGQLENPKNIITIYFKEPVLKWEDKMKF